MTPAFAPRAAGSTSTWSIGIMLTRARSVRRIGSSSRSPACATPPATTILPRPKRHANVRGCDADVETRQFVDLTGDHIALERGARAITSGVTRFRS